MNVLVFVGFLCMFFGPPLGIIALGGYIVFLKRVRFHWSTEPIELEPMAAYIIGGQILIFGLGGLGGVLYFLFF